MKTERCFHGDDGLEKKDAAIRKLKEQKKELEEHRDQLTHQLKKIEAEKNENKKKLQQVEDTSEKKDLLNVKSKLDDQQKDYESFVLHVDQLLQTTDTLLAIESK